jgi:hypothetical protein
MDVLLCNSEDCSYSLVGVRGTVGFDAPWNATRAAEGIAAAGFAPPQRMGEGNQSFLVAGAFNDRNAQAGPDQTHGGFFLTFSFPTGQGHGTSHAKVREQANATWPSHSSDAGRALAAFENATGWRHARDWTVDPIEAVR